MQMGKKADPPGGTEPDKKTKTKGRSGSVLGPVTTTIGALLVIAALVCDSFGDHVLRGWLEAPSVASWSVAVQYHMSHGIALVGLGVYIELSGRSLLLFLGVLLLMLGTALFSGSLYVSAFSAIEVLSIMPLLGGSVLLLGWLLLALHTLKQWRSKAVALSAASPAT